MFVLFRLASKLAQKEQQDKEKTEIVSLVIRDVNKERGCIAHYNNKTKKKTINLNALTDSAAYSSRSVALYVHASPSDEVIPNVACSTVPLVGQSPMYHEPLQ